MPFRAVGIVGVGLIGGSIARALRSRTPEVRIVGVDRPSVLSAARAHGLIDDGSESLTALADLDLVVLAAPVLTNAALLPAVAAAAPPGAVLTDVGGVKRPMHDAARRLPAGRASFIGGHPMAGAAAEGLDASRADLFVGSRWLLTHEPDVDATAVTRLMDWVRTLGAAPIVVDVEVHDRTLAYVSHLAQLASIALMAAVADAVGDEGLALSGPGLRDAVRLAASPSGSWRDVCAANAEHIERALDELMRALALVRAGVRDPKMLADAFQRAHAAHAALERASSNEPIVGRDFSPATGA